MIKVLGSNTQLHIGCTLFAKDVNDERMGLRGLKNRLDYVMLGEVVLG